MNSSSSRSASASSTCLRSWAPGSTNSPGLGSVSGSHGSVRAAMRSAVVVTSAKLVSDSACSTSSFSGLAAYRSCRTSSALSSSTCDAQHEGLGQPAVHRGHRDRALGFLEIRQRRGEHAQASQRDAQGDLGRVGEGRVELGVVDDRGQQLDDVRPALRAVIDDDCDPPGFAPARAARSDARDQLVCFFKLSGKVFGSARRSQRRRVGEVEIVRAGRPKAQVEPGVVDEPQCLGRQFHPALQRARRARGARSRFQHRGGQVAGSGQPGPRVALVVGDAGKRGETRPGGGQVGRTLTVVDHDAERTAAGGEPADDVTVNPACLPGMRVAELRACRCHRLPQPHRLPYIVCPNLTRLKLALPKLIVEAPQQR